jgi:sirohydrochlorin cobaltochelatase
MVTPHPAPVKQGILLVVFGSHTPQALSAYQIIENKVRSAFSGVPVRWAFTSAAMRKKMWMAGRPIDSMEMVLARMMDEGITHAAVQSLHVIAGKEYHDLTVNCKLFGRMHGGFRQIEMGLPLLGSGGDIEKTASALLSALPDERKPDEAVIFMGHGSAHPANACYTALMYHLQQADRRIFVGMMSGRPSIDDICDALRKQQITSVFLMPCLAVVGNHTLKDMAGDGESSWKSILIKHGFSCKPVLKGLAENDAIADIWVNHLKDCAGAFS